LKVKLKLNVQKIGCNGGPWTELTQDMVQQILC